MSQFANWLVEEIVGMATNTQHLQTRVHALECDIRKLKEIISRLEVRTVGLDLGLTDHNGRSVDVESFDVDHVLVVDGVDYEKNPEALQHVDNIPYCNRCECIGHVCEEYPDDQ